MTNERGMLYGLTVYAQRRVPLAPVDAPQARELLIREALVAGQWDTRLPFFVHNRRLVAEIEALEQRIRRPDLLVDERDLFDWYDARIPEDIHSVQALERWWKTASREAPKRLFLSREALLRKDPDAVNAEAFPRTIELHGAAFELAYRFDPGAADDGVTMTVPIAALNLVDATRCEWLVPGMLADKVQALLKSLPQRLRRHLVPLPEYATGFVERWRERAGSRALVDAIVDDLAGQRGMRVQPGDFRVETVPVHLSMNFRVVDAHGGVLAQSRQLAALRAEYGARAKGALQQAFERAALVSVGDAAAAGATGSAASAASAAGTAAADASTSRAAAASKANADTIALPLGRRFTDWSFGTLPERIDGVRANGVDAQALVGYPALVDLGDAVELQVFDDPAQAAASTRAGLARLFIVALKEPLKFFTKNIPGFQRMSLQYVAFGGADDLRDELVAAVVERSCLVDPLPTDAQTFAARVTDARTRINLVGQELARTLAEVLDAHALVQKKLQAAKAHAEASEDVRAQLAALLPKRFVSRTPAARFRELPRYLKAIAMRLDKLREVPTRDARVRAELEPLQRRWRQIAQQRRGQADARMEELRWLFEELRVSLFAQELRTPVPVSVKRLGKALDALRG